MASVAEMSKWIKWVVDFTNEEDMSLNCWLIYTRILVSYMTEYVYAHIKTDLHK